MNWTLTGYKTYIAAGLLAACGILEGFFGFDIPGIQVDQNWFTLVLGAIGLGGLRAAIGKK